MRSRKSPASPEWCMTWPPNHPAPQSGNKTQHINRTHSPTQNTNTLSSHERALLFLSFLPEAPYPTPTPRLPPPLPFLSSTFPWKADRTVTGVLTEVPLLHPPPPHHHSYLVLIFLAIGIDSCWLLIWYCHFWSMYNNVFPCCHVNCCFLFFCEFHLFKGKQWEAVRFKWCCASRWNLERVKKKKMKTSK